MGIPGRKNEIVIKLRQAMEEIRILDLTRDEAIVDEIDSYFNRSDDHDRIKAAIKKRYGIGITVESDPAHPEQPYKLYSRGEFNIQVDAGTIGAIDIGFGQKVVSALATLFTEPGQRFDLAGDDETDTTDQQTLMADIRDSGGMMSAIVNANRASIQCGSAAMFISAKNEGLKYQRLIPSQIRCYWPEIILDGDVRRAPDYSDIEDAYAIVIRTSMVDLEKYNYLAIFSRSEDWPNGRWVEYTASPSATKLPDIGEKDSFEYEIDGKPANPLSYWANTGGSEYSVPEFPIIPIMGVTQSTSTPFPVSTSLYEDDIEFTITASHILSKGDDAAGGTDIIELDQVGAGAPLPKTLSGAITTLPGQTYRHESRNAADVKTAWEAVQMLKVASASGYAVPDYMMVSEDYALEASSGIALQVKTRPLVKERQRLELINKTNVARIFEIEKALLNMHLADRYRNVESLLPLHMEWSAGPLELPENKQEKAQRLVTLMDKGVIDVIAAIREYNNFATDGEAEEEYNRMKARQQEFPPLVQEKPKQVGMFRNAQQPVNNG
jgi:hypothetical protein